MKLKQNHIIIVLSIVAAVAIGFDFFFISQEGNGAKTIDPQYPYLDPAQSLYSNNDLLVNMHPLGLELKGLTQNNNNVAIYFQFLNTGSDIRINTNGFYPGSLMKVPVAMAVMKKIESGAWSMDDKLTLTDADKNSSYGTLYQLPSGTSFTVSALLQYLLVDSDDTARDIFVRTLGDPYIEGVLNYLGLQDVVNNNLQVTAQRYSNFWRALYSTGYLSADSSQQLLQIMAVPHDQDLLYAGMPSSTIFSHKIGVYGDIYSDSGIVYVPNRPYILTVMIESSSTDEVHALMKSISQDVFQYITTNNGT